MTAADRSARAGDARAGDDRAGDDRGVATVWAAGVIAVLMSLTLFGLHLGGAMLARHHAESAADLAALAAAGSVIAGERQACSRARVVDRPDAGAAGVLFGAGMGRAGAGHRPPRWSAGRSRGDRRPSQSRAGRSVKA
jgi:hypothetical protein